MKPCHRWQSDRSKMLRTSQSWIRMYCSAFKTDCLSAFCLTTWTKWHLMCMWLDQEGYSKSLNVTEKVTGGESLRLTSFHFKGEFPTVGMQGETNQREWLPPMMGWWGRLFVFWVSQNPVTHRLFLLKNHRGEDKKYKIHLFSENLLSTVYIPGTDVGAEGTVVNKKPLALMQLLSVSRPFQKHRGCQWFCILWGKGCRKREGEDGGCSIV